MSVINVTYQEKIRIESYYSVLNEIADFWSRLSCKLSVDLACKKMKRNQLKKKYISEHGILARQFNSMYCYISGLIDSRIELMNDEISDKKMRLEFLSKDIQRLTSESKEIGLTLKDLKQSDTHFKDLVKEKKQLERNIHYKKRKLDNLQHKLIKLENDLDDGIIRVCFGTKKLFKKQFKPSGLSHSEWKQEWVNARNHMFFCIGSKDEVNGNQNCRYSGDELKLRIPRCLEEKYGQYLTIKDIDFNYGNEMMEKVTQHYGYRVNKGFKIEKIYQVVSYRFIRKRDIWYVHASLEYEAPKEVTSPFVGELGIDFNVNHLNCYHVDRYGNPINHFTLKYEMYSKSSNQIKDMLNKVAVDITNYAEINGLMVV
ncbi:hypothetical protein EZV73_26370, partial [Acidaminobacter sp. JC074]|uniref:hypothetical protein n=1 Tax=Acidaminobacter sp. JC074 TaxID=2530199 RepID=UPI001F105732